MNTRKATTLIIAALCVAALVGLAPLAVYATSLAMFGLWHVASEMRYVVGRFSGRFPRDLWVLWSALLAFIVALRIFERFGGEWPGGRSLWEIVAVVALLLFTVVFVAKNADRPRSAIAATATVVFGLVFVREPVAALALLAFAHNLTPVGFLLERFRGEERRGVAALATFVFLIIPLAIVVGVPFVPPVPLDRLAASLIGGLGSAERHYSAFLPPQIVESPIAARLFACAAYLQCAHYFTVIVILPRCATPQPTPPRFDLSKLAVLVAGALLGLYFLKSFADARRLYAIPAAVHAFLEWPLFLALLLLNDRSTARMPVPT